MSDAVITAGIAAVGTLGGGWLAFKAGIFTAKSSKDASLQTTHVDAQESALAAWQDLLQPYRDEVATLRSDVKAMRQQHEVERKNLQDQVTTLIERVDMQAEQIKHWKRLAKVIARWASTLRDEVLRLGGTVPSTPDELLLIQSLGDDDD